MQGVAKWHPLADAVLAARQTGALKADDLLALVDAREAEAGPDIHTLADWR